MSVAMRNTSAGSLNNGTKNNEKVLNKKGGGGGEGAGCSFLKPLRQMTCRAFLFLFVLVLVLLHLLQTNISISSSSGHQLKYDVKMFENSTRKNGETKLEKKNDTMEINPRYKFMSNVQLFVSAFPGGFEELGDTLAKSLEFFWPLEQLDLLVILDEFNEPDATAKQERKAQLTHQVKSKFKHITKFKNFQVKWNPRYENYLYGKGWFIQQLAMFWADNFTDSPYIGFVDDDAIITRAIDDYDLFDEQGRPKVFARYLTGSPHGQFDTWYQQNYWIYGNLPAYLNAMSYFPVIIKREHLAEIRQAILSHHKEFLTFDEFYSALQRRGSLSQFMIWFDYLWLHHRDEYSWHFEPFLGEEYDGWSGAGKGKYYYVRSGSPKENNVTEEMLRPFHRSAMHGSYVVRDGKKLGKRENRPKLMHEFLRSGYCYSQPVMPVTELGGNNETTSSSSSSSLTTFPAKTRYGETNYVSVDKFCRNRYDVWNNINVPNEWRWSVWEPFWAKSFYRSCLQVHRERMIRNIPNGHIWDKNEVHKLFEPQPVKEKKENTIIRQEQATNQENVYKNKTSNGNHKDIDHEGSSIFWWSRFVSYLARPFRPFNDASWCTPEVLVPPLNSHRSEHQQMYSPLERNLKYKNGMFYVRIPKTASSTTTGIAVQVADNVARRINITSTSTPSSSGIHRNICNHHATHGFHYTKRVDPFFLWSVIRHPAKRAMSHYYFFDVTRGRVNPTDDAIKKFLLNAKNFQLEYLMQNSTRIQMEAIFSARFQVGIWKAVQNMNWKQIIQEIRSIVDQYHFIGLVERMEESLAVFNLLFGFVQEEDLIVLSAKQGGYDDGMMKEGCLKMIKSKTSPDIDEYLSAGFRHGNYDYFLYEVISKSLDLTIEMLGKERVQEQIYRLRSLQQLGEEHCQDVAVFPCTKVGPPNPEARKSCYLLDSGCGHACIRETMDKYKAGQLTLPTVE